jgi:hypothetical protein
VYAKQGVLSAVRFVCQVVQLVAHITGVVRVWSALLSRTNCTSMQGREKNATAADAAGGGAAAAAAAVAPTAVTSVQNGRMRSWGNGVSGTRLGAGSSVHAPDSSGSVQTSVSHGTKQNTKAIMLHAREDQQLQRAIALSLADGV